MILRSLWLSSGMLLLAVLVGCGGGQQQPAEPDNAPTNPLDAARQAAEAAEAFSRTMEEAANKPVATAPVDFRRLRELLPAEVAGMARSEAGGETVGMTGFSVSSASGVYSADDGRNATLKLLDVGTMPQLVAVGMMTWMNITIDKETETGFERTVKIDGFPAYETFNRETGDAGTGEIQVIVGDRFLVTLNGSNITYDQLRDAIRAVNLGALDGMKNENMPGS